MNLSINTKLLAVSSFPDLTESFVGSDPPELLDSWHPHLPPRKTFRGKALHILNLLGCLPLAFTLNPDPPSGQTVGGNAARLWLWLAVGLVVAAAAPRNMAIG